MRWSRQAYLLAFALSILCTWVPIKHGMAWARLVEEQVRLACPLIGARGRVYSTVVTGVLNRTQPWVANDVNRRFAKFLCVVSFLKR